MAKYDKADLERRMKGAVEALRHDLGGLRTGRANTTLLDPVVVGLRQPDAAESSRNSLGARAADADRASVG